MGIDRDAAKLESARRHTVRGIEVRFEEGDCRAPPNGPFDAAVIVDVLYLLDESGQRASLSAVRDRLADGGLLVWKAQEPRPRLRYAATRAQEWLATRLGLTEGETLEFLPREAALRALRDAGFRDARVVPMRGRLYTDVIYTARR